MCNTDAAHVSVIYRGTCPPVITRVIKIRVVLFVFFLCPSIELFRRGGETATCPRGILLYAFDKLYASSLHSDRAIFINVSVHIYVLYIEIERERRRFAETHILSVCTYRTTCLRGRYFAFRPAAAAANLIRRVVGKITPKIIARS